MSDDLISISEIAIAHARHKSSVHKTIKRLGINTHRFRTDGARGQEALHIAREDYALLIAEFEPQGVTDSTNEETDGWRGFLYIIQLEPELDPGRFKIGFAGTVDDRLRSHRTSAPFAALVRQWPCKRLWEQTAIESITQNCEKLHTEVFRTDGIEALGEVLELADRFFLIMPKLAD